jgi:CheY-like chemotaxis protein
MEVNPLPALDIGKFDEGRRLSRESKVRGHHSPRARLQAVNPGGPILLVEDEPTLRLAVSTMLSNRGFSVLQAGTGESALDIFHSEEKILVVLLDLTLPGKSGRSVLEELLRIRPNTAVILTSAYSRDLACKDLRHNLFIRKPYRLEELERLLREALATGPKAAIKSRRSNSKQLLDSRGSYAA